MLIIEPPRGKSNEEIYEWCLELCEKINREGLEAPENKKEKTKDGDKLS